MDMCHRKYLVLVVVIILGIWTCYSLDSVSLSKYEMGKSKFRELELYAANENYGECWINAVEVIKAGCHKFTEETHAKMALAYLNCFLELQGRQGYICSESDPVEACTKQLSDTDRSNYATFFTHTHSICYFLQSQVWHEKTQKTIQRLSLSSEQVADQLEETSKLQQKVIARQNESLKNQETILDKAHNLSKIINTSSENIHEMLSDFKKTSVEQRNLINNLFDRVAQIQTLVSGEMATVYSLVYYISAIFIAYLLTSANKTSGARLWLFVTMLLSMGIEWMLTFYVFKRSGQAETFQEQADSEVFQYRVIWYWRKFTAVLGACILVYKAYRYRDVHELNHQHLQDLRTQFSNFSKVLKELVEKTPQKETDHSRGEETISAVAKVPTISTPTQETGSPEPTGSPAKTGSHIVPIPVEHLPDTPVSQKSYHGNESHSEPSSSKSRNSRSKRSLEREIKALKAISPYSPTESKRDLLTNWAKSGYYTSSYTALKEDGELQDVHEDPLEGRHHISPVVSNKRAEAQDIPDDSTDISLRSTKRYSLRARKRTNTSST